jgi:hypothetical protein
MEAKITGKTGLPNQYYLNGILYENKDYIIPIGFKKINRTLSNDLTGEANSYRSAIWYYWEQQGQRRFLHVYSPLATDVTISILIGKGLLYTDIDKDPFLDKITISQICMNDTSILNKNLSPDQRSFNFQQAKTAIRLNNPNATFEEIKAKWEAYLYLTQILRVVESRSIAAFVDFYKLENWNILEIYSQNIIDDPMNWKLKAHFYNLWEKYISLNPDSTINQFMKTLKYNV